MSTEDEVREASKRFYEALNRMANGDAGPMAEVWSHGDNVTTQHPVGGRQIGWDQVRKAWEGVADIASEGRVELGEQRLHVAGDMAYEVGSERVVMTLCGKPIRGTIRATNIYRREGGTWKMVHHHGDLDRQMKEACEDLPGQK